MSGGGRISDASAGPAPRPAGYALVIGSYLLFGLSATLVTWADAPQSVLLVDPLRSRGGRPSARVRPPASAPRGASGAAVAALLLMGALDAFTMIAYFYAVRAIGVATATFFLFLQPVWVAFIAPRFLHAATERVVYVALADRRRRHGPHPLPSFTGDCRGACPPSAWRPRSRRLDLRLLPDAREAADARGLQRDRGHRGVRARRRVHPAARPLAVRRRGSGPHRARLGRGRGHGPRHHGARVHDVDRGRGADPRAAQLDPRPDHAGRRADLRPRLPRAGHRRVDDRRRLPDPVRRRARGPVRRGEPGPEPPL